MNWKITSYILLMMLLIAFYLAVDFHKQLREARALPVGAMKTVSIVDEQGAVIGSIKIDHAATLRLKAIK